MILRMIDDLGRVVIPKDMRKSLEINMGDTLEIRAIGESIVITKHFEDKTEEHGLTVAERNEK